MIRTAFFDLDDTLFDHQYSCRSGLEAVWSAVEALQSSPLEEVEAEHSRILEKVHEMVARGAVPVELARVQRFAELLRQISGRSSITDARMAASLYRDVYRSVRRPVPGAIALLEAIREHVSIAVVSNNVFHEQRDKLLHCRLDSLVDELVVSGEVGVTKPDRRIFEVALRRMGATADRAVMVGDSWTHDIAGARNARIRAVWFNRNGLASRDSTVPMIESFEAVEAAATTILE